MSACRRVCVSACQRGSGSAIRLKDSKTRRPADTLTICYLGIGSNLGNRRRTIETAVTRINSLPETRVLKVSRMIETKAVGVPAAQPRYLNGAVKISTSLSPAALLRHIHVIEKELGRLRPARNAPRTIDIDILLYGDEIIRTKNLTVPHPRMFGRDFVMKPLLEIL